MNKKFLFILIPLLALLLFNGRTDDSISVWRTGELSFSNIDYLAAQGKVASGVNLQRDSPQKIKNKIRIKAWDDAAAVIATAASGTELLFSYYYERSQSQYCFSFRPAQISANSLRGPPAMG